MTAGPREDVRGALQLLHALLEASPAAVIVYDAAGRITHHSSMAAPLLAVDEVRSAARGLAAEALTQHRAAYADEPTSGPEPGQAWRWQAQPMRVAGREGGVVTGVLVLAEDITEHVDLQRQARTDALTGVLNHRGFHERVVEEAALATRHGHPLSVALIDIDDFKSINDALGHPVGDRVLREVARCICSEARETDVVGRVGGDELALLMPHTDGRGAVQVAERVHGAVGAQTFADAHVTLSIGLCELDEADDAQTMMRLADRALYFAKTRGRDMVWRHADGVQMPSASTTPSALVHSQAAAGVRALARAMDFKDAATRQHSDRVAELAGRLAETMGWPPARTVLLREVGRVHDVGKVGIPDDVLLKPSRLTDDEYDVVRSHARLGAQIASEVLTPEQTAWVRSHHERVDGSGYPDGLAGDEIPDGARILAVADAFDVMISDRPYARGRDPEEAIEELQRCSGTHFDPEVVAAFHTPRLLRQIRIQARQERIRAANEGAMPDRDGLVHVRCECADDRCEVRLVVGVQELAGVRAHQRRYVVADGHDVADVERVVSRTPRFLVVEKRV